MTVCDSVQDAVGNVWSMAMFDFETLRSYALSVSVHDPDGLNVTGVVAVGINDKNDPPVVTIGVLNCSENQPVGTRVNGTISVYVMLLSPQLGPKVAKRLMTVAVPDIHNCECERCGNQWDACWQVLHSLFPSRPVHVPIATTREMSCCSNLWHWGGGDRGARVDERGAEGKVPFCLRRYDQDTTPSLLRYFAFRNGSAVPMQFVIDTLSGVLTTLTTLDFEASPWDAFLVTVSDLGLNVTVAVNVSVIDRNDSPVFVCNGTAAPACYVFM